MTFSPDWLALREPADAAARSTRLARLAAGHLENDRTVRVLDLAAGTGANLRCLMGQLAFNQSWVLADHDAVLLLHAASTIQTWAEARRLRVAHRENSLSVEVDRFRVDVRTKDVDLAGSLDPDLLADVDFVTASALLDLVSERWLRMLAEKCRLARAVVLFALTYDGRIECHPNDAEDDLIRSLVNTHQRTDKGFGKALGPSAVPAAERILRAEGYVTARDTSDWLLDPDRPALQRELIDGWAEAALETAPAEAKRIDTWRARRLAHVDSGRSRLIVGHEDIVGWVENPLEARTVRSRG